VNVEGDMVEKASNTSSDPAPTGLPRGVLVVDDDEGIRSLVRALLKDEGYAVETAPDGATALALLETLHPELILLDMAMPAMDGRQFIHRYRALPGPHAPIVVFVAAASGARSDSVDLDVSASIHKPFELDDLLRIVERYARRRARPSRTQSGKMGRELRERQRDLRRLRQDLATWQAAHGSNSAQVERIAEIEAERPLTREEREHAALVRRESEHLRWELERIRREFDRLREEKQQLARPSARVLSAIRRGRRRKRQADRLDSLPGPEGGVD
jgi:CheY-like chemotaxis protein